MPRNRWPSAIELNDLSGQAQSLHYHGIVLYAGSEYQQSIKKCREAIRLLERTGDFWQVHIARYQIAASLYRLGDLAGALEEAQLNYKSGIELGDEQASGIILDVWVRATGGEIPESILKPELARQRHDAQGRAQVLFADGLRLLGARNLVEAKAADRASHRSGRSRRRAERLYPALFAVVGHGSASASNGSRRVNSAAPANAIEACRKVRPSIGSMCLVVPQRSCRTRTASWA